MSRYLAAFLAEEDVRFSASPVPNKSEKPKNPDESPPGNAGAAGADGFSPFSPYSGQGTSENTAWPKPVLVPDSGDELAEVLGIDGSPPDPAVREREWAAALAWAQEQGRAGWPGFVTAPVPLPPPSPEHAAEEAADRAAVAEVDGGTDPARWRLANHMAHAAHLRGLQAAALARPPSWPDPSAAPSEGIWCSCCRDARWWREAKAPRGWRCWSCHPPVPGADVTERRT